VEDVKDEIFFSDALYREKEILIEPRPPFNAQSAVFATI
jgi:hypothetical protein